MSENYINKELPLPCGFILKNRIVKVLFIASDLKIDNVVCTIREYV